jgi:hypothetical protein
MYTHIQHDQFGAGERTNRALHSPKRSHIHGASEKLVGGRTIKLNHPCNVHDTNTTARPKNRGMMYDTWEKQTLAQWGVHLFI